MPYITHSKRVEVEATGLMDSPGELNFALSKVVLEYLKQHKLRYQTINDIVGALEGCKAEFQRRVVGPYEDKKIKENGDL